MKNTINIFLALATLLLLATVSCKKDDKDPENPQPVNPEEQITTVVISGHNHDDHNDAAHQFSVVWEDLDGNGGNAPHIDSLLLDTGIAYHINLTLIDKTKTPWDTISREVAEEKNVHQFFYTFSASLEGKVKAEIQDRDDNNLPVGLDVHLPVRATSPYPVPVSGTLNIVLSHYDGVVKTTERSPESDLDVTFPVKLYRK